MSKPKAEYKPRRALRNQIIEYIILIVAGATLFFWKLDQGSTLGNWARGLPVLVFLVYLILLLANAYTPSSTIQIFADRVIIKGSKSNYAIIRSDVEAIGTKRVNGIIVTGIVLRDVDKFVKTHQGNFDKFPRLNVIMGFIVFLRIKLFDLRAPIDILNVLKANFKKFGYHLLIEEYNYYEERKNKKIYSITSMEAPKLRRDIYTALGKKYLKQDFSKPSKAWTRIYPIVKMFGILTLVILALFFALLIGYFMIR